ncbi:SgcJ/EcaC family oxidoreductase [Hyphomicrobium sp.]|jgi:uncharacterized protein (TIGR02246 family)|uniref:SgcJ/EcaC family oxidoreductase n=1 Tax=Hyphomicrobium sp. TaxID=82 RepID=UPI00356AF21B
MISSLHIDTFAKSAAFRFHMTVFVTAALLGAHYARADEMSCVKPTPQTISQTFDSWNAAVASGSAGRLADFYAEDATLITAKGAQPLVGKKAIRNYYTGLLARHPQPAVVSMSVTPGCNTAVVNGFILYRVTGQRKGTRDLLGGRFVAEFALQNGAWRIARHTLGGDERTLDQPFESSML